MKPFNQRHGLDFKKSINPYKKERRVYFKSKLVRILTEIMENSLGVTKEPRSYPDYKSKNNKNDRTEEPKTIDFSYQRDLTSTGCNQSP